MSSVLVLTDRSFESTVLQSGIPVLVEFGSSWCVPSQQQKAVLDDLSEDGLVCKFGFLNTDQNPKVPRDLKVKGCPALILFKEGKEVYRGYGSHSKGSLLEVLR